MTKSRRASTRTIPGLYKRGGVWWASWSQDGERKRRSLKTRDKKHATLLLSKIKEEVWLREEYGLDPEEAEKASQAPYTLDRLRTLWTENKAERWRITGLALWRRMLGHLGGAGVRADKVRRREVTELRDRLAKDLSPSSVNKCLTVLSAAYNEAIRRELLASNPCVGVKRLPEHNQRDRIATDSEIEGLLNVSGAELRLAIAVGVETGMRLGEIAALTWERVDLERRLVTLRALDTKTRKARRVPLSRKACAALEDWGDRPLIQASVTTLSKRFERSCELAGIEGLRFHDLRHTSATRLRRAGVDVPTIMRILGHTSPRTSLRYQTVDEVDLVGAVDKLG